MSQLKLSQYEVAIRLYSCTLQHTKRINSNYKLLSICYFRTLSICFFSYTQNKLYSLLIFRRETSTFLNEVTNVDDMILFKNQKVNISTLHEQETSFRNNLREAIYHTLTQLTNAHFYYFIFI